MHLWCDKKQYEIEEEQFHPKKLTVWAGLSSHGIIGPDCLCEMVTLESYHKLLSEYVIPELENQKHLKNAIFQQDGAKLHTTDVILMLLRKTSKKCVFSNGFPRFFNCGWLCPLLPDLNPCHYFLRGYLKHKFIEIIWKCSKN